LKVRVCDQKSRDCHHEVERAPCHNGTSRRLLRCLRLCRRQVRPKCRQHIVVNGAQARREQRTHRRYCYPKHADQQQRQGGGGHCIFLCGQLTNESLYCVRAAWCCHRDDCDNAEHAHKQRHERSLDGVDPQDPPEYRRPLARLKVTRGLLECRNSLPVGHVDARVEERQQQQGHQSHAGQACPCLQRCGALARDSWQTVAVQFH